jgi:hypothetical protein
MAIYLHTFWTDNSVYLYSYTFKTRDASMYAPLAQMATSLRTFSTNYTVHFYTYKTV